MTRLFRHIQDALRGFVHAKWMTFVSIMTVAMALFFMGVIAVGILNIHAWLNRTTEQAGVAVYLEDWAAADSAARIRLEAQIKSIPHVAGTDYVSKDHAWERFSTLYGPEMLEAVDENPLPASFEVVIEARHHSPEELRGFAKEVERMSGVEGVGYAGGWVDDLDRVRNWFWIGSLVIVPLLFMALHFVISNTVKLTIYARRDLVTNMRFVGATDRYIEAPFILEGMFQGMLGGLIAISGLLIVKTLGSYWAVKWGPWYLFPGIFLTGAVIGWLGSSNAVRRFLK